MSTTFYVSALNQTTALDTSGNYTGSIEVQQSVNEDVSGTIPLADAQAGFLFRTSPGSGTGDTPLYNTGLEGSANWTAVAKTVTENAITNVGDDHTAPMLTVEKELAAAVFGSHELFDLFSNGTKINTSISNAFAAMNIAVQNSVSTDASKQYGNAMIRRVPERFALKYNAAYTSGVHSTASVYSAAVIKGVTGVAEAKVVFSAADTLESITVNLITTAGFTAGEELSITDPNGKTSLRITVPSGSTLWDASDNMLNQLNAGSGLISGFTGIGTTGPSTSFEINTNVAGTFTGVVASQVGYGTGSLCTMKIDTSTGAITSLFVTSVDLTPPYVKNVATTFTITFTISSVAKTIIWTIPATTSSVVGTNSVQAAILNGNTDSADIEFPTQSGDVLRVMFTITPNAAQTVANSSAIAVMTYKAHINYTVGQFGGA